MPDLPFVLRFLDFDGTFKYFTGTNNDGAPQFSSAEEARILTTQNAPRFAALCVDHGFDVDIEQFRESMLP